MGLFNYIKAMTHVGKVHTKSQNVLGIPVKVGRGSLGQIKGILHPTVNSEVIRLELSHKK